MRLLLTCLAAVLLMGTANATDFAAADTTGKGLFGGATATAKKLAAKHEYNERNYRGALVILRDVLEIDANDAEAYKATAECYFQLKKYKLAQKNLLKAVGIDPSLDNDIDFFYGQIFHYVEELDSAIARYRKHIETKGERDYDSEYAKILINQCEFAKIQMANPLDVTAENLGREINSRYEEYAPAITADGKTLYYTSRRNTTTGGDLDKEGDYKFFEDIMVSHWNEEEGAWDTAEGISGDVNTIDHDAVLSIHPNGKQMFIYRNSDKEAADIFISNLNDATNSWTTPQRLPRPINTTYFEGSVSITPDGETLYFISERQEGYGRGDIYMAKKEGNGWSNPENLGPIVNTMEDEKFVFIHPDGKSLFFASEGHQTMGSYDIFKTEYVDGQWSAPLNLGYPINTVNEESTFSITEDKKTMYLSAEFDGGIGERDIYKLDISNFDMMKESAPGTTSGTLYINLTYRGKPAKKWPVEIIDPLNGAVVARKVSTKTGGVEFVLPANKAYELRIEHHKRVDINQEVKLKVVDGKVKSERRDLDLG